MTDSRRPLPRTPRGSIPPRGSLGSNGSCRIPGMKFGSAGLFALCMMLAGVAYSCASDQVRNADDSHSAAQSDADIAAEPGSEQRAAPASAGQTPDSRSIGPAGASADQDVAAGSGAPVEGTVYLAATDSTEPSDHDFFSTVAVDDKDFVSLPSLGDLWVNCWSDDDAVYTASGDGTGFGVALGDIVVSRVDGRPDDVHDPLQGTSLAVGAAVGPIWSGLAYTHKPTGMLCVNGEFYLAVQDLRSLSFSDAPAATIVHSTDKGRTWSWDPRAPMFSGSVFTTIMFADFGKDNEHAPDGFAYAYGLDDNWSSVYSSRPPQTKLYLARVPNAHVQDRSRWEFFSGLDAQGAPTWTAAIEKRAPVLEDPQHLYETPIDPNLKRQNMTTMSQGGVVYNAALKRYIYSTWTMYTYEFYEAPQPWGPWTHFFSKDFGAFPWTADAAGGYGTSLPSKFISEDGRSMWMHSNVWEAGVIHYQYSLREVRVTPYEASTPSNERSADALSTAEYGAVPLRRSAHSGHVEYLNDAVLANQSLESWTGDRKTTDYWGYTWPHVIHVNKVRYTTGAVRLDGGWFEDLTVQVRRGKDWVAVSGLTVAPAYAHDASVLGNRTFTLSFDAADTDGVRIFGRPGGSQYFTSTAELGVYYE
jgi:hypothetical protein